MKSQQHSIENLTDLLSLSEGCKSSEISDAKVQPACRITDKGSHVDTPFTFQNIQNGFIPSQDCQSVPFKSLVLFLNKEKQ